jgi:two-component system, response regulator, stage 0 sporulation protein F
MAAGDQFLFGGANLIRFSSAHPIGNVRSHLTLPVATSLAPLLPHGYGDEVRRRERNGTAGADHGRLAGVVAGSTARRLKAGSRHRRSGVMAARQPIPSSSQPSVAPVARPSAKRVLIVDDEPEVRSVLGEIVKQAWPSCAIVAASNVEDALAVVRRDRPDLVLLDVLMPSRDGVEGLKEIQKHDPTIRVVMITAADLASTAAALHHGALGYIPKPFDLRYVSHFIAAALGAGAP